MGTYLITARTDYPLTLDGVKDFLQETENYNDALINILIASATEYIEQRSGRILMTATYEQRMACWPACNLVRFRWNPVQSVTSVKYVDANGDTQTVTSTDYATWIRDDITVISFNDDYVIPTTDTRPEAWLIRYVAGYPAAYNVPDPIKQSMLMRIRKAYDNRQDEVWKGKMTSDYLIEPYIIYQ